MMLSVMLVPPLAGRTMKYLLDVPFDGQQFIGPLFLLLVLGVKGVLLRQQFLDLRCQFLGRREFSDSFCLKETKS